MVVVDRDSKEGREYMAKRIRHNFTVNKIVYTMILIPLVYLPIHFLYSQAVMWRDYEAPYYAPPDQKQKWRKNKYRDETEEEVNKAGWFFSGWFGRGSAGPDGSSGASVDSLAELKARQAEAMGGGGGDASPGARHVPKMRPLFLREDGEGKGGDWGFTSRAKLEQDSQK